VSGSYQDTNALANITIAGWSQGCSAVKITASGKSVSVGNVKISSSNGALYVMGLDGVAKAFDANLSITFS
jgi:alpha-glucosidase